MQTQRPRPSRSRGKTGSSWKNSSMQRIREETQQVEPGGDGGEKEGTGLFGTCVKVKVLTN